jgi:hypothetical protein
MVLARALGPNSQLPSSPRLLRLFVTVAALLTRLFGQLAFARRVATARILDACARATAQSRRFIEAHEPNEGMKP